MFIGQVRHVHIHNTLRSKSIFTDPKLIKFQLIICIFLETAKWIRLGPSARKGAQLFEHEGYMEGWGPRFRLPVML
jgi:hypothetical protein